MLSYCICACSLGYNLPYKQSSEPGLPSESGWPSRQTRSLDAVLDAPRHSWRMDSPTCGRSDRGRSDRGRSDREPDAEWREVIVSQRLHGQIIIATGLNNGYRVT